MKFGRRFKAYLNDKQRVFPNKHKYPHVDYKRLKKLLRRCRESRRRNNAVADTSGGATSKELGRRSSESRHSASDCGVCDHTFFAELTHKAEALEDRFSTKVRPNPALNVSAFVACIWGAWSFCLEDQHVPAHEARMIVDYITMNSTAISKILKKYDKTHASLKGRAFRSRLRGRNMDFLEPPWVVELGAFSINSGAADFGEPAAAAAMAGECASRFSFDLNDENPAMVLSLSSDSEAREFSLSCSICFDVLFNAYALGCGHMFCKRCACQYGGVTLLQGIKQVSAARDCPYCRTVGVYKKAKPMIQLDVLVRERNLQYWKRRLAAEHTEFVEQLAASRTC